MPKKCKPIVNDNTLPSLYQAQSYCTLWSLTPICKPPPYNILAAPNCSNCILEFLTREGFSQVHPFCNLGITCKLLMKPEGALIQPSIPFLCLHTTFEPATYSFCFISLTQWVPLLRNPLDALEPILHISLLATLMTVLQH